MIRPDPLGAIDILSGILIIYTVSSLPETVLLLHASFLLFKGFGTIIRPEILPMPIFVLGGFADIMSAAILLTGTPPILGDYINYIAGILLIKGVWSGLAMLG